MWMPSHSGGLDEGGVAAEADATTASDNMGSGLVRQHVHSNIWLQWSMLIFAILITYDGAVRKWLLPSMEQIIFITKDALIAILMGHYVMKTWPDRLRGRIPPLVALSLIAYAAWVTVEAANLNLPSVLVGIWGLKSHILYMALIFLVPATFRTADNAIDGLTRLYPYLVVPTTVLAAVQLTLPQDHFLNAYVRETAVALFGRDLVRVTGPFSYISGMAAFVQVSSLIGLWLFLLGKRSLPFIGAFCAALAMLPVTGSRSVIAIVGLGAIIILLGARVAGLASTQIVVRAAIGLAVIGTIGALAQDTAWQALQSRFEQNRSDETPRMIAAFTNAFDNFDRSGWFGFGSGAANFGAAGLITNGDSFYWLPGGYSFEEESGRIVLELGIIGWILSILMRAALTFWSVRLLTIGASLDVRALALAAVPFMAFGFYSGNGVFAATYMAVCYWFCVGLLAMAEKEQARCLQQIAYTQAQSRILARRIVA